MLFKFFLLRFTPTHYNSICNPSVLVAGKVEEKKEKKEASFSHFFVSLFFLKKKRSGLGKAQAESSLDSFVGFNVVGRFAFSVR